MHRWRGLKSDTRFEEVVENRRKSGTIMLPPMLRAKSPAAVIKALKHGEARAVISGGVLRIIPVVMGGVPLGGSLPTLIYNPLSPPTPLRTRICQWDTGNDTTGDGSELTPYKTVSKLISIAQAGDQLLVKDRAGQTSSGGDSSVGYVPTTSPDHVISGIAGNASNPIVLKAFPGHRPVIRPPLGATPGSVIARALRCTSSGTSYWAFVGLDLYHSSGTGGNESVISGLSSAHHLAWIDCDIHGGTDGSGAFIDNNNTDIQFLSCEVYENDDWRGTSQQSHGLYSQANRTLIANCISRDHANGFGFQIRSDASGPTDVWVVHNVGARANTAGSGVAKESAVINGLFYGNIGYDNDNYALRGFTTGGQTGSGNKARKNIGYLNVGSPDYNNGGSSHASGFDWSADGSGNYTSPPGDNLDNTDPKFINPGANNFRLQADSPAKDYGLAAYCPQFDFDLHTRFAPDAGAFALSREPGWADVLIGG
jgi:hypothetical protein